MVGAMHGPYTHHIARALLDDRLRELDRRRAVGPVVRAAVDGDHVAWTELFRRFTRRITAVARAHRLSVHETDDIVQDTWLRALEHLRELRDPESVAGWLNTTARRECLRHIGLNAREVLARSSIECEAVDPSAYDVLEGAERSAALQRAFDRVKARERALMRVLLADPEPTYAEISAALGMPIGSIGPTRMRAIARLREDRELADAVLD